MSESEPTKEQLIQALRNKKKPAYYRTEQLAVTLHKSTTHIPDSFQITMLSAKRWIQK